MLGDETDFAAIRIFLPTIEGNSSKVHVTAKSSLVMTPSRGGVEAAEANYTGP